MIENKKKLYSDFFVVGGEMYGSLGREGKVKG